MLLRVVPVLLLLLIGGVSSAQSTDPLDPLPVPGSVFVRIPSSDGASEYFSVIDYADAGRVDRIYRLDIASGELALLVDWSRGYDDPGRFGGILEGDIAITPDESTLLFDAYSDETGATIWSLDLTTPDAEPVMLLDRLPFYADAGNFALPRFTEVTNEDFTIETFGYRSGDERRTYTLDGTLIEAVELPSYDRPLYVIRDGRLYGDSGDGPVEVVAPPMSEIPVIAYSEVFTLPAGYTVVVGTAEDGTQNFVLAAPVFDGQRFFPEPALFRQSILGNMYAGDYAVFVVAVIGENAGPGAAALDPAYIGKAAAYRFGSTLTLTPLTPPFDVLLADDGTPILPVITAVDESEDVRRPSITLRFDGAALPSR